MDEELETMVSADGRYRVTFCRSSGGFFTFVEDSWDVEDLREFGGGIEEGWTPSHFSGLYATEDDMRADAEGILPWLRRQGSSTP